MAGTRTAFIFPAALLLAALPAHAGIFSSGTPAERAAAHAAEMQKAKVEIARGGAVSGPDRMVLFAIQDGLEICIRASKAPNLFNGCEAAYRNFRHYADKAGR